MNMKRVKLIVAYDGTNYCGWQVQINGITVEEVLNKTLSELCHEDIKVIGASRTDSGVHALGNVAVFDTESGIPGEKFSFALNQRLPEDIRIQESCQVADDFHPRYCDTIKTYEYKILNRRFDMPTERLYSTFVYYPLDIDKMKRAAAVLVGEHDFKSFCSSRSQVENTVRTITDITIDKAGDMIHIRISGNGFLYNVPAGIGNGGAGGEDTQLGARVLGGVELILKENIHQDTTGDTAQDLSNDIAGNQSPVKHAAHSQGNGQRRIEAGAGGLAEDKSGKHNSKTPGNGDLDRTGALHAGFVEADVGDNAVAQKDQDHSAQKLSNIR